MQAVSGRRLRQLIARQQRPRLPSEPPRRPTVVAQRPHAMDMITRAIGPDAAPVGQVCAVNSHNEWDPLEEVIVGRLEGATIPSAHPVVTCNIPGMAARAQSLVAGFRYPKIMIGPVQRELDCFVALLQSLGIVVTRPEPVDHKKRFSTPEWFSHGFCNSCPRDSMLGM